MEYVQEQGLKQVQEYDQAGLGVRLEADLGARLEAGLEVGLKEGLGARL